jgi:hypothetical protein
MRVLGIVPEAQDSSGREDGSKSLSLRLITVVRSRAVFVLCVAHGEQGRR